MGMDGATPVERERNVRTRGVHAYVRVLKPLSMMFYGEGVESTEEVCVGPCRRLAATKLYARGATLGQMRRWLRRGWIRPLPPGPRTSSKGGF